MLLEINLSKNKTIALLLYQEKKIIDKIEWQEKNDLSQTLLSKIDEFLAKNQVKIFHLEKVKLKSEIENQFTMQRIAQAITQALNYSLSLKENK